MFNNTETSLAGTTETDISRKTSSLASGVDYLVIYYANHGSSDNGAEPLLYLKHGATGSLVSGTEIGHSRAEGIGTSDHWASAQLCGVCEVTGDGTSVLGFTADNLIGGGDTIYVGACAIIAIPRTDFPSGSYYFGGTNSGADELTDASTSVFQDIGADTFNLDETADYLIMMSTEVSVDHASAARGYAINFTVDGTPINPINYREEAEDTNDQMNVMACDVQNLSAGNHDFACELMSLFSASCDGIRSRRVVVKMDAFDQFENRTISSEQTVTATTYGTSAMLSGAYTPNQEEYVVVLGCFNFLNNSLQTSLSRLRNTSDSVSFCEDAGEYLNDEVTDYGAGTVIGCEQISAATTYEIGLRVDGGTGSYGDTGTESRLIFWSLTTPDGGISITPDAVGIPLFIPDPVVMMPRMVNPDPVTILAVVPDPAVDLQLDLSPTPVIVMADIPNPVAMMLRMLAPDPVTIPAVIPDPDVDRQLDISPDPLTIPAVIPDPDVEVGRRISADPVIVPAVVPDPLVMMPRMVEADPVTLPAVIPDPSITLLLTLAPDPVTIPAVVPDPALSLTLLLTPDPVAIPGVVPDPLLMMPRMLTPDPVTAPLVVPSIQTNRTFGPQPVMVMVMIPNPVVDLQLSIGPDPVLVPLVIPDPSMSTDMPVAPDPVTVALVVPTPDVSVMGDTDGLPVMIDRRWT